MNLQLRDVAHLTLVTSESCNLSCKYCTMANMESAAKHASDTLKVKQALDDGTYLENIKNTFKIQNLDRMRIQGISLWGQEPTLTLNEFTKNWEGLMEFFPNSSRLFLSTNGVNYGDRIINLIQEVNKYVTNDFYLDIQFSFDGEEETLLCRGVDPKKILNNIEYIITESNKLILNSKLHVQFHVHNVISFDLINRLNGDKEKIKEFWDNLFKITSRFHKMITNPQCFFTNLASAGIIHPYNATVEDGKNFAKFYKITKEVDSTGASKGILHLLLYFFVFTTSMPSLDLYDNALRMLTGQQVIKDDMLYNRARLGCSIGTGDIKLRYDGTLLFCHSQIFDLNPDELIDKTDLLSQVELANLNKDVYPNLLDGQTPALNKFIYKSDFGKYKNQMPYLLSNIIQSMMLLRKCGQIDKIYDDDKTLIKHAFVLAHLIPCFYANMEEVGSMLGMTLGKIRMYANGFLEDVVNAYESHAADGTFTQYVEKGEKYGGNPL